MGESGVLSFSGEGYRCLFKEFSQRCLRINIFQLNGGWGSVGVFLYSEGV